MRARNLGQAKLAPPRPSTIVLSLFVGNFVTADEMSGESICSAGSEHTLRL